MAIGSDINYVKIGAITNYVKLASVIFARPKEFSFSLFITEVAGDFITTEDGFTIITE